MNTKQRVIKQIKRTPGLVPRYLAVELGLNTNQVRTALWRLGKEGLVERDMAGGYHFHRNTLTHTKADVYRAPGMTLIVDEPAAAPARWQDAFGMYEQHNGVRVVTRQLPGKWLFTASKLTFLSSGAGIMSYISGVAQSSLLWPGLICFIASVAWVKWRS